jgi:hypothetical protein
MRPNTALMIAAQNEAPNDSFSDARTRGAVTVCQNASHVSVNVLMNAAESGMRTISVR